MDVPADSRPVPERDQATAIVRQGVLGSLVPLASAARLAGVPVPATKSIIQVVGTLLGADLASAGRRLENIGFADADPDDVRRAVGVTRGLTVDADLRSIDQARRAAESAHQAQQLFRSFDPARVDQIVAAMARAVEVESARLGRLAADETGHGNAEDKRIKNLFNSVGVAEWLAEVKTLGVLWHDPVTRVMAIGEPMGVVAALIPVTNPTSTVIFKVLSAVKAGNAIVCAPHPRAVRSGVETTEVMRAAASELGAPDGLIQCLSEVTHEGTGELMRHRRTSLVLATGGSAMVRTAYSSGKPTLAVGPGNVPVYVHQSSGPNWRRWPTRFSRPKPSTTAPPASPSRQ